MSFTACLFAEHEAVCEELLKSALDNMERRGSIQPVNRLRQEARAAAEEEVKAEERKENIANLSQRIK